MACVIATGNDFYEASRLFEALNGGDRGTDNKPDEEGGPADQSDPGDQAGQVHDLPPAAGERASNATISKLLNGSNSRGRA